MSTPEGSLRRALRERRLQIAIDGPAGAGKSTLARALAECLDCVYLDTGLMYRAVTLQALDSGIAPSDGAALAALARSITFCLEREAPFTLLVNGRPASDALRSARVDAAVSEVSAHPAVRDVLVAYQRDLARGRCIVMAGRDIGTTVLPRADVKLWVTASVEERARRRLAEQSVGSGSPGPQDMLTRISVRDDWDSSRPASPLRQSEDAAVIETDRIDPSQALEEALAIVRARVL